MNIGREIFSRRRKYYSGYDVIRLDMDFSKPDVDDDTWYGIIRMEKNMEK